MRTAQIGPDLRLRFRVLEVAVTANAEKSLLNIEIDPEHRDLLRFLWLDDVNKESPEIIKVTSLHKSCIWSEC